MRISQGLALTMLFPAAVFAQTAAPAAPTLGQKIAAARPDLNRMNQAFQYVEAQALAESLIPAEKPAFDKSTGNATRLSTQNYADLCQAYFLAFQAADNLGQWEKGLDYLNKALDVAKDNVAQGKESLTEQRDYWAKTAKIYRDLLDKNADAIKALHAKTKLEDYEEGPMNQVKTWEKDAADGEKWNKFFQYYLDMANRTVEDFQKFVTLQDKKIKDQQADIDGYKPHPGDKAKWVDAVVSNKSYLEAYADKADKIALLYRLTVLDPDSHKARHTLDVVLGKASPEPEKPAPKKRK